MVTIDGQFLMKSISTFSILCDIHVYKHVTYMCVTYMCINATLFTVRNSLNILQLFHLLSGV